MTPSVKPAALAIAAGLFVCSSPVSAMPERDILETGSVIGPPAATAGRDSQDQGRTAADATMIRSALGPDLCVSVELPGVWKVEQSERRGITAIEAEKGAEIEIVAYTDADFPPGPETLMRRAASNLQDENDRLLGKPAQVTTLEPVPISSAMRWTATWIDGNFAQDDRALSIEGFIIEPVPNRVVEVAVSTVGEWRAKVIGMALETVRIGLAPACPP
jgi:hypothetical protein